MKQIHFLNAMPRSGNTFFSAILNQNPKINVSANSLVTDIIKAAVAGKDSTMFQNFPDHKSYDNVLSSVFDNYYKDWPGEIIIDRSPAGYGRNFQLLKKYHKQDFKCIVLVRDLFDIFASYLKWSYTEPSCYLNHGPKSDKEKIEVLMHKDGIITQNLLGINNLYYDYYDNTIFIHYNDLVKDPKKQIDRVYNFLGLEAFEHSFENLKQFEINGIKYNDNIYGKNMHTIKSNISIEHNLYKEKITKEIYERYFGINEWLTNIK